MIGVKGQLRPVGVVFWGGEGGEGAKRNLGHVEANGRFVYKVHIPTKLLTTFHFTTLSFVIVVSDFYYSHKIS